MLIKTLVENSSISQDYGSEHGLSLYVETNGRKILFDVGASSLFYENAKKLNVDISDIDILVISHGHYDHGGGLTTFLDINKKSKVYIQNLAFEKYYALREKDRLEFIGLEENLKQNKQIILTSNEFIISNGIQVFSNIIQIEPLPASNSGLLMEQNDEMMEDIFAHEQVLIIEEGEKTFLITGCAHNGIVNILRQFNDLKGYMPNYVIGGFHLSSRSKGTNESIETIDKISKFLMGTKAKYYTCHCTGLESYNRLKSVMAESIDYLKTGMEITI